MSDEPNKKQTTVTLATLHAIYDVLIVKQHYYNKHVRECPGIAGCAECARTKAEWKKAKAEYFIAVDEYFDSDFCSGEGIVK